MRIIKDYIKLTCVCLIGVLAITNAYSHPGHRRFDPDPDKPYAYRYINSIFDDIRNVYTEPGSNPAITPLHGTENEYINTFSGLLQLKYTDIFVPANGGLSMNAQRNYLGIQPHQFRSMTSLQRSVNGLGWQMHFGRLFASTYSSASLCEAPVSDPVQALTDVIQEMKQGWEDTVDNGSDAILNPQKLLLPIQKLRNIVSQRVTFSDLELESLRSIAAQGAHDIDFLIVGVGDGAEVAWYDLSDIAYDVDIANDTDQPPGAELADTSPFELGTYFIALLDALTLEYSTRDSIAFEFPDGSRHSFFRDDVAKDGSLLSLSRMKLRCESEQMVVITPDGTKYFMTEYENFIGQRQPSEFDDLLEWGEPSWSVSKIRDVHGNEILIDYVTNANGIQYVTAARSSDSNALAISYTYEDVDSDLIRLKSIEAGSKKWEYQYETVLLPVESPADEKKKYDVAKQFNVLKKVVRPDGRMIEYGYDANTFQLAKVTTAYDLEVNYQYTDINFLPNSPRVPAKRKLYSALSSKTLSGSDISPVTWSFAYAPGSVSNGGAGNFDVTTITGPYTTSKFYHYGGQPSGGNTRDAEFQSLRLAVDTSSNSATDPSRIVNSTLWTEPDAEVSSQSYSPGISIREYAAFDDGSEETAAWVSNLPNGIGLPSLFGNFVQSELDIKFLQGGGSTAYGTSYQNHDVYGAPQKITELVSGNITLGKNDRVHELTYKNDTQKWILGLPESDEVSVGSDKFVSSFSYDGKGLLSSLTRSGVTTSFTYSNSGDLASIKDANGHVTKMLDYANGIPKTVTNAENETVTRQVNATGTVASISDPRGNATQFSYDNLDRVVSVTPPTGSPSAITYPNDSFKQISKRGPLTSTNSFDVLGRLIESNVGGIVTKYRYDLGNRNTFASYPDSESGTASKYDAIGRLIEIADPSGAKTNFEYNAIFSQTKIINKRGFEKVNHYTRYGFDPYLVLIDEEVSASDLRSTIMRYNVLGAQTSVAQGVNDRGQVRTFSYDDRFFLKGKSDPEVGTTLFTTDNVGNVTSSTIASTDKTTHYAYDKVNRLKVKDFPDQTDDVFFEYLPNGLLKSTNTGSVSTSYSYDANSNLKSESLSIGGQFPRNYTLGYSYDNLENLTSITYPDGLVVDYNPDSLGRPRKVGTFASNVTIRSDGQLGSLTFGNGKTLSYNFDTRLLPTSITTPQVLGLNYSYDPMGNITSIKNSQNATHNTDFPTEAYDGVDRLKNVTNRYTGAVSHEYDLLGNISKVEVDSIGIKRTTTYDYKNKLRNVENSRSFDPDFSFNYDTYGNVTNKTKVSKDSSGRPSVIEDRRFLFDDASRLLTVQKSVEAGEAMEQSRDYMYDGHNQRVANQVRGSNDINFSFYSMSGDLMYEESIDSCEKHRNIRLGSMLLARKTLNSVDSDLDTDGDTINDCLEFVFGLDYTDPADALADADGDGISNADEILKYYTRIDNTDSDGDGVPDNEEVAASSNPNSPDSDGDGVDDSEESTLGLSPTNNDTDNDGVSDLIEQTAPFNPTDPADGVLDFDSDGFSNRQESLLGFDPLSAASTPTDTGGKEWTFHGIGQVLSAPTLGSNGVIYYGTESGNLYAVHPNGKLYWKRKIGSAIYGSVVFDKATSSIYFGASNRNLYAFSLEGNRKWQRNTGGSILGSPALDAESRVYVSNGSRVLAYSGSGVQLWSTGLGSGRTSVRSRLAISNRGLVIVADSEGVVRGLEPETGGIKWKRNLIGDFSQSVPVFTDLGKIVIAAADSNYNDAEGTKLYKLDSEGNMLWSADFMKGQTDPHIFSSPVVSPGGTIYIGAINRSESESSSNLLSFSSSGVLNWEYPLSGAASTPAIASDGTIYVADYSGILQALNPDGTRQWISLDLPSKSFSSPAIDVDGTIYLGFANGFLQAYADNTSGVAEAWSGLGHGGVSSSNECQRRDGLYSSRADQDSDGLPNCFEIISGLDIDNPADGQVDSDADGLTAGEEYQYGTDDKKTDTDGDGLSDREEIENHNTNPLESDTDGDGVGDAEEIANGTNPNEIPDPTGDSDGDGFSNRQESIAGTDVNDAGSSPKAGESYWTFAEDAGNNMLSLLISRDQTLLSVFYDGVVRAITPYGRERWEIKIDGERPIDAVLLDGSGILVLVTSRDLVGLNIVDGSTVFTSRYAPIGVNIRRVTVSKGDEDAIFLTTRSGHSSSPLLKISAFDKAGNLSWESVLDSSLGEIKSLLLDSYGHLKVVANKGIATINQRTGETIQSHILPGVLNHSGLTRGGSLHFNLLGADRPSVVRLSSAGELEPMENVGSVGGFKSITRDGNLVVEFFPEGSTLKELNVIDRNGDVASKIIDSGLSNRDRVGGPVLTTKAAALTSLSSSRKTEARTLTGQLLWSTSISGLNDTPPRIGPDGSVYIVNADGITSVANNAGTLLYGGDSWATDRHDNAASNNVCESAGRYYSAFNDTDTDGIPDCHEYLSGLDFKDASDAVLDSDGDTLTNAKEFELGTDLLSADTDGDGLSDAKELNETNTNPILQDTDLDGLPDGYEIEKGLNPLVDMEGILDSDNDGYSNRQEVVGATNPLNNASRPKFGLPIWEYERSGEDPKDEFVASPILDADSNTYIGDSSGSFVSLDLNGKRRWEFIADAAITTTAVLDDANNIYIVDDLGKLYSLNSSSGHLNWSKTSNEGSYQHTPAVSDKSIYVATSKKELHSYDYEGNILWSARLHGQASTGPLVASDGTVLISSFTRFLGKLKGTALNKQKPKFEQGEKVIDGSLLAFSSNGKLKWSVNNMGRTFARPVIGKNGVIFTSTSKALHAVSSLGKVLWRNQFRSGSTNSSRAGLVIDGENNLYRHTPRGFARYNVADGSIVWQKYFSSFDVPMGYGAQPIVTKDGSILILNNEVIRRYSANGDLINTVSVNGHIFSTPRTLNVMPIDFALMLVTRSGLIALTSDAGPLQNEAVSGGLVDIRNTGNLCAISGQIMVKDSDSDGYSDCFEMNNGMNHLTALSDDDDSDGDGLPDRRELVLGTSNALADSDYDGLSDLDEVSVHNTSPIKHDTDSDGLEDGYEIANHTDPLSFLDSSGDADGDGFSNLQEAIGGFSSIDASSSPKVGDLLWSYSGGLLSGSYLKSSPVAFKDGSVAFLDNKGLSYLSPFGDLLWQLEGDWFGITIADDKAIYLLSDSTLNAIDRSGNLLWKVDFKDVSEIDEFISGTSRLAVSYGNLIYIRVAKHLVALQKNGDIAWVRKLISGPYGGIASPIVLKNQNVAVASSGGVSAFSEDGSLLWTHESSAGELAEYNNGDIAVLLSGGALTRLSATGVEKWSVFVSAAKNKHISIDADDNAWLSGTLFRLFPDDLATTVVDSSGAVKNTLLRVKSGAVLHLTDNRYCTTGSYTPQQGGTSFFVCSNMFSFSAGLKYAAHAGAKITDAGVIYAQTDEKRSNDVYQPGYRLYAFAAKDARAADSAWPMESGNPAHSRAVKPDGAVGTPDDVAPVVTAPANVSTEATAIKTDVFLGTPVATDDRDGIVNATASDSGPFSLGETIVTWSAADSFGNIGTDTQVVSIVDTTPPVIAPLSDIVISENDLAGFSLAAPTVSDIFPVTLSNNAPSSFAVGIMTITWTATDTAGNQATATQKVTVNAAPDSVAPVVTAPADVQVEAAAIVTTVSIGTASANDDRDGLIAATSDNTGPFPLGVTTVTWSAIDAAGNTGSDTQVVTIVDTTAPAITAPANVSTLSSAPIAVTLGDPVASDIFTLNVTNDAPALFPSGDTVVTWTATDTSANKATATQTVTVNQNTGSVAQCASPTNIAPQGSATQSSDYNSSFPASKAVNGDTTDFTHTAVADNAASWALDFPQPKLIKSFVLHNRDSCCGARLSDITVSVEDSSGAAVFTSALLNPGNTLSSPATIAVDLPAVVQGNHVVVRRTSSANNANGNVLSLGEVIVQGCNVPSSNVAPNVSAPGNQTAEVNASVSLQVTASDADGDTLTYSATGLPTGLTIDSSTGLISGTPTAQDDYSVTVSVSDGSQTTDQIFSWDITAAVAQCTSPTNIAPQGSATQSSDYNSSFPASKAINGSTTDFTHTAVADNAASWVLDFTQAKLIESFVLHNRDSCCGARLSDITVSVEDSSGVTVFTSALLNPSNALSSPKTIEVDLPAMVQGNRVVVRRTSSANNANGNILSLGEVIVQGCNAL